MYGATAWKLGILWIDATTNQAVCSIQNTQWLFDPKFIYYFLFKEREKIISDSFGWAQPNISKSYIDNIQIPLPPLATQHAITRLLDDASASIHTTTDALRTQIAQLDALRASTLDEMFGNEEWEKVKLGEISHKIQYWYTGKTVENWTYKYLRITDIQNNTVNRETVPFVDVEDHEAKKYLLNTWDVIFARTWATVWKSFLIDEVWENKIFASYLIRVVPQYNYIIPEFLKYFFQSWLYRSQIYADVVWAAQPNFNGKKLGEITIPLPDLATQTAIVSRLDHLSQSLSFLRSSYTTQLTHHDELRASILDQAFSWQLIQV